jgi:hypothetical protein
LVNELRHRGRLLEGPDVELHQAQEGNAASASQFRRPLRIADGFCRADEILVLSPHGEKSRSGLAGCEIIGAWKLADYEQKQPGQVSFLSVNKAKGLDSLAMILIDLKPLPGLGDEQDRMDYFMGASRAPNFWRWCTATEILPTSASADLNAPLSQHAHSWCLC